MSRIDWRDPSRSFIIDIKDYEDFEVSLRLWLIQMLKNRKKQII